MRSNTWQLRITFLAAIAGGACATTHAEFKPTERVEGTTVQGFEEAFYDLDTAAATSEAKVWSSGADLVKTERGPAMAITVGITIDNGGSEPIEVVADQLRLESVQATVAVAPDLRATSVSGDLVIQPQTSGTVQARFLLPGIRRVDQVQAFRLRWTVTTDGREYTEFTPFVQQGDVAYVPVYAYYYPYAPFDHPFYHPYWYPRTRVIVVRPYPRHVVVRGHRRPRR
jgi:hypothetical protein